MVAKKEIKTLININKHLKKKHKSTPFPGKLINLKNYDAIYNQTCAQP